MNEHSLNVLEFDKVKENIGEYAILDETKGKILDVIPMKDINSIKKELENVQDFMDMLKYDGGIELSEIKNILVYLKKTSLIGTYLDVEDLYHIARNLRVFRVIKTKFQELEVKYRGLYM